MLPAKKYWSISTAALGLSVFLTGCAAEGVSIRQDYIICPRPEVIELPALSEELHLAHPYNAAKLMELVDALKSHVAEMDSALDCYEAQSRRP